MEIKCSNYISTKTGLGIGYGLFCKSTTIKKGEIISMYIGENISNEEWNDRNKRGKGGYGLYVNSEKVKDCRESFEKKECYASAANCSKNIKHKITMEKPSINAYLIIISGFCFLKSCTDIEPNTEIILDTYGNRYKFVPKENLVENFI